MALKQINDDSPDMYSAIVEVKATPKAVPHRLERRDYPLFWSREKNADGKTDIEWILKKMRFIPKSMRHEVSEEYVRLFFSDKANGRKLANTYLHGIASQFRGVS
ncbi:hypothetical protein [Shewanella sp.]|uniref:hypothetical protein n=1 Tax=Shewanella sp. TaxID=50422 RepID=UPI003561C065